MKLESIVTSLETSKKLQEAGFEEDTCFWWNELANDEDWINEQGLSKVTPKLDYGMIDIKMTISPDEKWNRYPAYTFQQLLTSYNKLLGKFLRFSGSRQAHYKVNSFRDEAVEKSDVNKLAEAIIWIMEEDLIIY